MVPRTLLTALISLALAESAALGQGAPDDWVPSYYKEPSPDRFDKEVRGLAEAGVFEKENAIPPMIGFFSQVMAQNPRRIGPWITELRDLDEAVIEVLLDSAWYSDTESARDYFQAAGLEKYLQRSAPEILELDVNDPSHLDMLWGCFYATGGEDPVRRIVSALSLAKHAGALERYRKSSGKLNKKSGRHLSRWSSERRDGP